MTKKIPSFKGTNNGKRSLIASLFLHVALATLFFVASYISSRSVIKDVQQPIHIEISDIMADKHSLTDHNSATITSPTLQKNPPQDVTQYAENKPPAQRPKDPTAILPRTQKRRIDTSIKNKHKIDTKTQEIQQQITDIMAQNTPKTSTPFKKQKKSNGEDERDSVAPPNGQIDDIINHATKEAHQRKNNRTSSKSATNANATSATQEEQNAMISLVKDHIASFWYVPQSLHEYPTLEISIEISLDPQGCVQNARVIDTHLTKQGLLLAKSALRAIQDPRASPFPLQHYPYHEWKTIILIFSPGDAL